MEIRRGNIIENEEALFKLFQNNVKAEVIMLQVSRKDLDCQPFDGIKRYYGLALAVFGAMRRLERSQNFKFADLVQLSGLGSLLRRTCSRSFTNHLDGNASKSFINHLSKHIANGEFVPADVRSL